MSILGEWFGKDMQFPQWLMSPVPSRNQYMCVGVLNMYKSARACGFFRK